VDLPAHHPQWQATLLPPAGNPFVVPFTTGSLERTVQGWPQTAGAVSWPADQRPAPMPAGYLPYGTRLRFEFRVDPGEAWTTVATLYVEETSLDRPDGTWRVDASDVSGMLSADTVTAADPFTVTGTIADTVTALVRRTLPGATVTVDPAAQAAAAAPCPPTDTARKNPWELVLDLTDLAGCDAKIMPDGSVRIIPIPQLAAQPVDELASAVNMIGYTLRLINSYNKVVLEYEENGAKVTGTWVDDRPDSPMSVTRLGRRITLVEQRTGAPSQAQADAAARVLGVRSAGLCRAVSVTCLNRPWLEPGDTVRVTYAGGPSELALVSVTSHDLATGQQQISLRNSRYTSTQEA
jgi:hypothetical protein